VFGFEWWVFGNGQIFAAHSFQNLSHNQAPLGVPSVLPVIHRFTVMRSLLRAAQGATLDFAPLHPANHASPKAPQSE
jgi:hypothetical protein